MKRKIQLFCLSFFSTLAVVTLLCGFAVADENTRSTGYGSFVPMFSVSQTDALHHRISVMGNGYNISLESVNTAAKYAQKLVCFVPAGGRLGAKLAALAAERLEGYLP